MQAGAEAVENGPDLEVTRDKSLRILISTREQGYHHGGVAASQYSLAMLNLGIVESAQCHGADPKYGRMCVSNTAGVKIILVLVSFNTN